MKLHNQYSKYFDEYKEKYGKDIFVEYKNETDESRKEELIDWVFRLFRSKNEIPVVQFTESQSLQELVKLSNTDNCSVYHDGSYWFNSTCVTFLLSFFPEIFNVQKGEGRSHPSFRYYFNNDYTLRKTVRKLLTYGNSELDFLGWMRLCGAGFCSNFRPATAKAIYELFGKKDNCRVFDSSAGYGARLLGAYFSSNVVEYVGIDPNTADSCMRLVEYLRNTIYNSKTIEVLKMGSEDFTKENFPQYENYFDLYFTSPPYFDTEQYSQDSTQSYIKFPRYDLWVKGFYQSTINNACDALKRDGIFIINIFEKVPKIKELTKLFLANNGWYVFKEDKYMLRTVPGSKHRLDENGNPELMDTTIGNNYEPIWYAKHYTELYREGLIDKDRFNEYKLRDNRGNKNNEII